MKIYNKEQIRAIENAARNRGIEEIVMMENAGVAAAKVITEKFQVKGKSIVIVCGSGNNGGDGFVVARKLWEQGAVVSVVLCSGMPKTEPAKENLSKIAKLPFRIYAADDFESGVVIKTADIIIDAVFGIGFYGQVDDKIAFYIDKINESEGIVIALDLPSGCECDTGTVANHTINADLTISFISVKPCHVLYPASDYCGKLINVGIGLPREIFDNINSNVTIIDEIMVKSAMPKYKKNAHKGIKGTLSLVCGSYGMAGAAILAGKAAVRCGVGLTKFIIDERIYPIVANYCIESVFELYGIPNAESIVESLNNSDGAVVGCGIGLSNNSVEIVSSILNNAKVPIVLDADGINIASKNIDLLVKCSVPVVSTPHPKEMARLLNINVDDVQKNRFKCAEFFARKSKKIVVLKGANTVVALPNGELFVCMRGNPGMATAGSGDVLAGIIGSFLAQGVEPSSAAIIGVYIHALAGDKTASLLSMQGMIASDMIDNLPSLFKEI